MEVEIVEYFTNGTPIPPGLFGYYKHYEIFDQGGDTTYEGTATDVTTS